MAKKEIKKVVQEARFKIYEELYCKLETKDVEKDICNIARLREKKN